MWFSIVKTEDPKDPHDVASGWIFDIMKERGWERIAGNWIFHFDNKDIEEKLGTRIMGGEDMFGPVVVIPTITDYPSNFTDMTLKEEDRKELRRLPKQDLLNINPQSWCVLHHAGWFIPEWDLKVDLAGRENITDNTSKMCIYPYYHINYKNENNQWPDWMEGNPAIKEVAQNFEGLIFAKLCLHVTNSAARGQFADSPRGDAYAGAVLALSDETAHNQIMDEVETTGMRNDEGYYPNELPTVTIIVSHYYDEQDAGFNDTIIKHIIDESKSPTIVAYKMKQNPSHNTKDKLVDLIREVEPFMMTDVPLNLLMKGDGLTLFREKKVLQGHRFKTKGKDKESQLGNQMLTWKSIDAGTGETFEPIRISGSDNSRTFKIESTSPALNLYKLPTEAIRDNLKDITLKSVHQYNYNDTVAYIHKVLDKIDDRKANGYDEYRLGAELADPEPYNPNSALPFLRMGTGQFNREHRAFFGSWMNLYQSFIGGMTLQEVKTFIEYISSISKDRKLELYHTFEIFTDKFAQRYLNRPSMVDWAKNVGKYSRKDAIEYVENDNRLNLNYEMDNIDAWVKYLVAREKLDKEGGWLND
tara:strand:- start:2679 stop:4436 length:1758 start_codon:yes stop_codon:yes gene_type:complete